MPRFAISKIKVVLGFLIFGATLIAFSQSTKLNVPKLLLPYSTRVHVNFTMTAERGCYKWVSSRPETARVLPLSLASPGSVLPPSSCSQHALVSALSSPQPHPTRGASVVQARDPVTGNILRCDVIIDQIHSIQIVTTTRQLFTEDPPLQLSVLALDSGGNTFSSLAGLEFNWRVAMEADTTERVRFVRFSEAGYTPPGHVRSLEERGRRGDRVLLQGLHSGLATVRVTLTHTQYQQVEVASVSLSVMDRLYLSPAHDVYLLLGSALKYNVWKTQQDKDTEVKLSEGGYELVVEGFGGGDGYDDVISVNQDTATVTALQLGHATLSLSHQSLPPDSASQLPRAAVHVVQPSYLTLGVEEEEDRWVLEAGRQYHVTVRVHDDHGHVAHLSQNVDLRLEVCDRLALMESSSNLSHHLLEARREGHTSITAALYSVLTEAGQKLSLIPPIRLQQEVEIYAPLALRPSVLVFPWQPDGQLYQHEIQVEGGSGSVSWTVTDGMIATVTVKGVVIAGRRRGQAEILAVDVRNPLHTAVAQVFTVRPARLQLLPQRGDCRVGQSIHLPLAVWGLQDPKDTHSNTHTAPHTHTDDPAHTAPHTHMDHHTHAQPGSEPSPGLGGSLWVTDCSLLPLIIHTEPRRVFTPIPGSLSPGQGFCGGVRLEAVGPGHTLVTVTVEIQGHNISATATLAAYSPLKTLVSEVLLTVGSSRLVVFEEGPQPWPLAPRRFYSNAQVEPQGGITVETLGLTEAWRGRHAYRVTCRSSGEQWLVCRCGNSAGLLNELPSAEESRVRVECGVPVSLSLSPLSSSPPPIPPYTCPLPLYPSTLLPLSSSRDAVLQLSVFDQKGAQFDNFTSCSVAWSTSDPSLLSLPPHSAMSLADTPTHTGYKMHGRQLFHTHSQTGTVTVTVTLTTRQLWASSVSVSANVKLVEDVQWSSRSLTLYNHPEVTENLTLVHGSGHFLVRLQDKQLANITHLENTNIVQVSPLRPGFSSLLVHDLCLTSADPTVTSLTVSDITDFQIDFLDIVELGHTALVRVRVLDSQQQPFASHFLSLMQLTLVPSSSIATVEKAGPLDRHSVVFRVSGQEVGVVSLHLSAMDGRGRVLSSTHRHLQVYPRFTLQPRKLTLALGSIRQVKWEGGPHPQSTVGFSVSDSHVATVTEMGLVRGVSVGVTKLRGALHTVTQDTLLTFTQDEVEVEVFHLTAVRIQAPLVRLSVGTEMPVFVMGSDGGQSPLSLGSVESGLSFHWSLGKLGVLEIQPRHTQAGISVSATHSFSVLVRAWAAGRTSLKLCVLPTDTHTTNHTTHTDNPLTDEIQILVFEEMQLSAGSPRSILMSPYSQYTLQSNKDTFGPVRYALCQCVSGAGLVTVDDLGVLRAGPDTGTALLEVVAMETCGVNQTLLISVRVSAVWFVRVFSVSALHSVGGALPAFPLGWSIRVRALCYDRLGHAFHAHNTHTHITTNRDDLVQVTPDSDSHSFRVQTVSPGLTILGLQGDPTNPSLSDYTPLPVLPAISAPPATLRPGDAVCFTSPLTDELGQPGRWNVSSSRILQMDASTGVALAKNAGTVVVYYRLEGGQQALREVTVEAAAVPVLAPPLGRVLTNWPWASDYTVSVELYTSATNTAQCTLGQREALERRLQPEAELTCALHFSAPYLQLHTLQAAFSTKPLYSMDTGQYSCRVSVNPQSDSVLRLLASSLPLSVSLSAFLRSHSHLPALPHLSSFSLPSSPPPLQLPYLPAFHCPRDHLTLTTQQPSANLSVLGTTHILNSLRFHSDSPDILLSEPSQSEHDPTLIVVFVYSNHFPDQAPPTANVTLYSLLLAQTHIVKVTFLMESLAKTDQMAVLRLDSAPHHQLVDFQLILVFAVFAVLAATAALFIVYHSMLCHIQTVPLVYTPSANTVETWTTCFSPWIRPSLESERRLRRRQWLWSSR